MSVKLVSHTNGRTHIEVFENRVLRRTFGSKREKVAGGCRRVRNVDLRNLYASPNVIRVMKSRWVI
jgi:hypothetical protein